MSATKSPPKLDPVFEATVRRMLATPPHPKKAVKKKPKAKLAKGATK